MSAHVTQIEERKSADLMAGVMPDLESFLCNQISLGSEFSTESFLTKFVNTLRKKRQPSQTKLMIFFRVEFETVKFNNGALMCQLTFHFAYAHFWHFEELVMNLKSKIFESYIRWLQ